MPVITTSEYSVTPSSRSFVSFVASLVSNKLSKSLVCTALPAVASIASMFVCSVVSASILLFFSSRNKSVASAIAKFKLLKLELTAKSSVAYSKSSK